MKNKITVICENSVYLPFPFIAEHGLAILIEGDGVTLFDTGQGKGLINNLELLGKNPETIDQVLISHGHYDHTGGLLSLLQSRKKETPIYAHPDAFIEKIALLSDGPKPSSIEIGFPENRKTYEENGAVFHEADGLVPVTKSTSFITNIKREPDWQGWDTRLMRQDGDDLIPDPFIDDGSLLLDTESGPVVLLGCAHAGVVEILDDLAERKGIDRFHAVIGGSHLASAPEEYFEKAIKALKKYQLKVIALSHCTGFEAACRVRNIFPDEFSTASIGQTFEF